MVVLYSRELSALEVLLSYLRQAQEEIDESYGSAINFTNLPITDEDGETVGIVKFDGEDFYFHIQENRDI